MNIMDNVARLKKRLLPLIFRADTSYSEDKKPTTFGKRWDVFRTKSFDHEVDPFFGSRSPTPRDLLKCKLVVPYTSQETEEEGSRYRSLSELLYFAGANESNYIYISLKLLRHRKL